MCLAKKNHSFRQIFHSRPPDRQTIAPKTSLAGLPSAIPTRPLKENKTRVIPNYIKKAREGMDYLITKTLELKKSPPTNLDGFYYDDDQDLSLFQV